MPCGHRTAPAAGPSPLQLGERVVAVGSLRREHGAPVLRDYHWLLTLHSLELVSSPLSEVEALWVVLWTQGAPKEGGLRMEAFPYTVKIGTTPHNLATLASGLKGAALAAEAAVKTAQTVAARVATEQLKKPVIEQARAYATDLLRDAATDAGD